jgi:outer membrane protein assembly factor BamB
MLLMKHRLLTLSILLWLLLIPALAFASPQNPLLTSTSIILSQQGVYKFDRQTLEPVWQSLTGVNTYHAVNGEQLIYVGSTEGLFALDPESGNVVWQIEPDKTIFSPTNSDLIYAGSLHGELYAINPADGSIAWRQQLDGWTYSPVLSADRKQLWTAGHSHKATLLDSDNGRPLGKVQLGQEAIFSPQKINDDHIAINLFDGSSAIINLSTASLAGRLQGNSQPRHLEVNGDIIYRTSRDGSLTAFDMVSHDSVWQQNLVSSDLSLHPASPGYLLLSDLDRNLLLLELNDNKVVYKTSISGQWFSPVQINANAIIYFSQSGLKPKQIRAVEVWAGGN